MDSDGRSKRMRERLGLSLPVRVHCRETADHQWVELTRLIDVTPFGARFALTRPTEPGRLLHLTLPMPRQLRCFDHVEQQYKIWALVRNVTMINVATETEKARFEVGVAFVGKQPPASFQTDPTRRYEVSKSLMDSGLWDVSEEQQRAVDPSEPRPETRHSLPVEVVVDVFDEEGKIAASERTVTENVSRRGAAVFTTLEVDRGRFVRITSTQYQISVVAAVRARRRGSDGITRLHLEFVDKQWPLEGVE